MKSKLFVALFCIMSASSAFASDAVSANWVEKSVDISQNWFDEYYTCDGFESAVKAILEKMGARKVEVTCSFGLPYDTIVSAHAKFSVASAAANGTDNASFQKVAIKGKESCGMHQGVVRQILPAFTSRNVRGEGLCVNPNDSYDIEMEILK